MAGAILTAIAVIGLSFFSPSFWPMMALTCLLGVGHVMLVSSPQMVTTRCSTPVQHDRVLAYFLVATALGQILDPMVIGLTTPTGAPFPDARLHCILAVAALGLCAFAFLMKTGLPRHILPRGSQAFRARAIIGVPGLLMLMVVSGLCSAANDLIIVCFPVFGAANGVDAGTVGLLLVVRATASMGSRFLFARLVARLGKLGLMTLSVFVTAIATGALAVPLPLWAVGLTLAGSGFSMGLAVACSISLSVSLAPEPAKATAMSIRLTVNRLTQFLLPIGAGASAVLVGPGGVFALIGFSLVVSALAVVKIG